jgi:drug/metabolite transporter (DMT)-like permease
VAGSLAGRGSSFAASVLAEGHWAHAVANPFTPLWVLLSIASMFVIQFAYRHERAVRLIPYFTSCSILVPVLGGVFVFGERLQTAQWAGVVMILTGLMLLTLPSAEHSA